MFDVLLVPGGYGQQALMHDEEVLGLIRKQVHSERILFSVCTGALLCGAAGVFTGRQVTTHWAARPLMSCYDAFGLGVTRRLRKSSGSWTTDGMRIS